MPDLGLAIVGTKMNINKKQESDGSLSESELKNFAQNEMVEERKNIMDRLGDFSMSGMTGSHIYNGQNS